ncbi:MAG: oxidoreductase [Rhodoglobus sp.]|nr:oxidoreductase [Rhodoglobus sp.]
MRVAVLGTGTMGTGIARTLRRNDFEVIAWNRTIDKALPLADVGATVAESSVEAVAGADVVLTILFDLDATLEVASEFLEGMPAGAVWMQSATVGRQGIRTIAELAERHGASILDSPVVGTKGPAEEGTLVPLVSGDAALIEKVRPVLDAIGSKTVVAGDAIGDASSLKLACNAWVASLLAGAAQSLAICEQLGVDPKLFLEAMDGGASNAPFLQLKGAMMLAGDFTPSFGLDALLKDITLMIEAEGAAARSNEFLTSLQEVYGQASAHGHGADDVAAVYTAFTRP